MELLHWDWTNSNKIPRIWLYCLVLEHVHLSAGDTDKFPPKCPSFVNFSAARSCSIMLDWLLDHAQLFWGQTCHHQLNWNEVGSLTSQIRHTYHLGCEDSPSWPWGFFNLKTSSEDQLPPVFVLPQSRTYSIPLVFRSSVIIFLVSCFFCIPTFLWLFSTHMPNFTSISLVVVIKN